MTFDRATDLKSGKKHSRVGGKPREGEQGRPPAWKARMLCESHKSEGQRLDSRGPSLLPSGAEKSVQGHSPQTFAKGNGVQLVKVLLL